MWNKNIAGNLILDLGVILHEMGTFDFLPLPLFFIVFSWLQ